jgi:predicted nucleic acid-binding protein
VKILLDTNAYSHLKRGHPGVADLVRRSETIVFSSIVAGELLFGFRSGARYTRNRSDLELFLGRHFVSFLPVSLVTAERFGRVAAGLKQRGTPLPSNDIWIAAHAMESGAELVSFDRHFAAIDGLAWTHFEP